MKANFKKMTLIVTMLTAVLAGISGVLQYLEKIDDANQKIKDSIESERKQREISNVQTQLIKRSDELRSKTNELLSLNVKLRENNELVIKLQNEQKQETQRLLSPINDRFRLAFQIWFHDKDFSKVLDNELTNNPSLKFLSLYPFQISDYKSGDIHKMIEDLINRINKSEINLAFSRPNLNYRPFDLMGELDLNDNTFLASSGNYNYKDVTSSAYKYNFSLTYNKDEGFLRLNVDALPIKIMFQHSSIVSLKDLNAMNVSIGAINDINYKTRLNSRPMLRAEKIEIKWIRLDCGSKVVGYLMDPVFDIPSKHYIMSNFKVSD